MPLKELARKNLRVLVPLAFAIALAGALTFSFITESFPLGEDLESKTLIQFQLSKNFDKRFWTSAVQDILGEGVDNGLVVTGPNPEINPTDLFLEIPVEYSENSAEWLKEELTRLGAPENSFSVMELKPWFLPMHAQQLGVALAGALVVLGLLTLVVYKWRRAAWSLPLVTGLNIVETLGIIALLEIPFGFGSVLGVLVVFMFSINTNLLLISRTKTGEDPNRRAREAREIGYAMLLTIIVFFEVFAMIVEFSQLFGLLATVMIGSLVNHLNTWWLNTGLLVKEVRPTPVKYHVAL
jgi:preprotein translocase subunit SecF